MTESRFQEILSLIQKKLREGLSPEEQPGWDQWISESPENQELADKLENPQLMRDEIAAFHNSRQNILSKIVAEFPELGESSNENEKERAGIIRWGNTVFLKKTVRYAAAIVLLICLSVVLWSRLHPVAPKQEFTKQTLPVHIPPGTNKAILTLGNGNRIILDSTQKGVIASEGGASVSVDGNQVSYSLGNDSSAVTWHTMTTPRGGQYRLTLPDGTAVWLNAQSSISYPVRFTGTERKVSITGEVYFEVVKNPAKAFVVDVRSKAEVRVYGTHFNINAYEDEQSINTTLLEGSISIRKDGNQKMLKPGEQAKMTEARLDIAGLNAGGLNEVTAWKDGSFYFEESDIRTILRQMQRWYDVDISYQGEVKEKFHVDIRRNTSLENVFRILSETRGVHFKVDGRKIQVMP